MELSYRTCCLCVTVLACVMALVPVKDYFLGSYVTPKFDEVRDDVVARKLNNFEVVTSSVHYFDTYGRDGLPLFDMLSQGTARMTRSGSRNRTLVDFLVHTSVKRSDLLKILPEALLSTNVSVMDDYYAPMCGPMWRTDAQLVFGHYFPEIRHEFCREFGDIFPHNRFFTKTPSSTDGNLAPSLGVVGLVNMSEVYLRHFHSSEVIRTLTRSVLSGFLGGSNGSPWQVNFSDATADEVIERYSGGVAVAELISMLPDAGTSGDNGADHVRLVDLVGISEVLTYFLSAQQLTMGSNINNEAAVIAEMSYATTSMLTLDYLVTVLGMGPVFPMIMAPFWNCGIELTTMDKELALETLDPQRFYACGAEKAALVPVYTVNLLYLTQKSYRDYGKLDNSSLFVVGRKRMLDFAVPEKLESSPLLVMDGNAWSKLSDGQSTISPTPFGYVYTHDCQHLVDEALAQQGRNVQKYQAFIGDGLGNCYFHDSQETELHVLCRLVFGADEVLLRDLDGNVHTNLSACKDLAPLSSLEAQNNFRQIEWFLLDTTVLAKRTRIRDNTSRQLRTSLLFLGMAGSISYVCEYLTILKSVWVFTRNGLRAAPRPRDTVTTKDQIARTIALHEFLQLDPAVGALQRPVSIVLLYLGAVGALSNIFSLACHVELAPEDGRIVIFCIPSIAITSISLYFTALSSGFWVALITQQTRSVGRRLRSQAESKWIRKWIFSHTAVLLIYASLKLVTDTVMQNVLLRSDPHFYAMCGGVVMTFLISMAFRVIHYGYTAGWSCSSSPSAKVSDSNTGSSAWDPRGHQLKRYPSFSARTATIQDRDFLSRWNVNQLDGVLQECATPTVALELIWYCSLRRSQAPLPSQSTGRTSTSRVEFAASDIRVHEFVAVHIAARAWKHLESLAWSYNAHGQLMIRPIEGGE